MEVFSVVDSRSRGATVHLPQGSGPPSISWKDHSTRTAIGKKEPKLAKCHAVTCTCRKPAEQTQRRENASERVSRIHLHASPSTLGSHCLQALAGTPWQRHAYMRVEVQSHVPVLMLPGRWLSHLQPWLQSTESRFLLLLCAPSHAPGTTSWRSSIISASTPSQGRLCLLHLNLAC